jgi:prefoldin subunit 4
MKLLEEGENNDSEVTWEDQDRINKFSKLNVKLDRLESMFTTKKTEKEYLEDLSNELELADEDELIKYFILTRYRVGECFVSLTLEECQARIEQEQQLINGELDKFEEVIGGVNKDMAKLKVLQMLI